MKLNVINIHVYKACFVLLQSQGSIICHFTNVMPCNVPYVNRYQCNIILNNSSQVFNCGQMRGFNSLIVDI